MKYNPSYFAVLPADVRLNKELTSEQKLIYAEITALSYYDGYCYASNEFLATLYGLSERAIRGHIARLEELGFLTREYRGKKRYIYTAHAKRTIKPWNRLEKYTQIFDDFGVDDEGYRQTFFEFLKHCQLNGRTVTNEKLKSMIVELDARHAYDDNPDIGKINELNEIINAGYFGLRRRKE